MSVQISDTRSRWGLQTKATEPSRIPKSRSGVTSMGATPPPHLDLGIGNSSSQGRFIATGALRLADQSCAEGSLPSAS
ncbi:hypothetical protein RB213_001570 [Colletotrichum asianum]